MDKLEKDLAVIIKEDAGFRRLSFTELKELLGEKRLVYSITLHLSFRDPSVLVNVRHGFINWNENRGGIILEKESKTYMNLNFTDDVVAGIYNEVAVHLETAEGLYVIFRLEPYNGNR